MDEFCRATPYRVLPMGWSFAAAAAGTWVPAEGTDAAEPIFHDTVRRGHWCVTALGLAREAEVLRPAGVFRSAGQSPPRYDELKQLWEQLSQALGSTQVSDSVRNAMKELGESEQALCYWPRRALDEKLATYQIFFYRDYWDKLAATVEREFRELHQQIVACLNEMLTAQGFTLLYAEPKWTLGTRGLKLYPAGTAADLPARIGAGSRNSCVPESSEPGRTEARLKGPGHHRGVTIMPDSPNALTPCRNSPSRRSPVAGRAVGGRPDPGTVVPVPVCRSCRRRWRAIWSLRCS